MPVGDRLLVPREHPEEGGDEEGAEPGKQHAVDGAQYDAERGSTVCLAAALRPQIEGDRRVDAHAEADAHGVCKVLQGKDEGDGSHGALLPLRDEVTVHNVVERVDEHGEDDGKRHLQHEGKDGLFFHKGLIHKRAPLRDIRRVRRVAPRGGFPRGAREDFCRKKTTQRRGCVAKR